MTDNGWSTIESAPREELEAQNKLMRGALEAICRHDWLNSPKAAAASMVLSAKTVLLTIDSGGAQNLVKAIVSLPSPPTPSPT